MSLRPVAEEFKALEQSRSSMHAPSTWGHLQNSVPWSILWEMPVRIHCCFWSVEPRAGAALRESTVAGQPRVWFWLKPHWEVVFSPREPSA